MNGYLVNFAAYSFAMIGFILTVVYVYKKSVNPSYGNKKKNFLQVENSLRISPVKTIYVIKAGSERFLIAGDTATTTMLAKLEDNSNISLTDDETLTNDKSAEFIPLRKLAKIVRG